MRPWEPAKDLPGGEKNQTPLSKRVQPVSEEKQSDDSVPEAGGARSARARPGAQAGGRAGAQVHGLEAGGPLPQL